MEAEAVVEALASEADEVRHGAGRIADEEFHLDGSPGGVDPGERTERGFEHGPVVRGFQSFGGSRLFVGGSRTTEECMGLAADGPGGIAKRLAREVDPVMRRPLGESGTERGQSEIGHRGAVRSVGLSQALGPGFEAPERRRGGGALVGILRAEVADQRRDDLRTLFGVTPQDFLQFAESGEGDRPYPRVSVGERVPQEEIADARVGNLRKPAGHRDPACRIAVRPAGEQQEEPLLVLGVEGPHGAGAHLGIGRLHPPDQRFRDLRVPHVGQPPKRLPADRGNRIVEYLEEPRCGCGAHRKVGLRERPDDADRFDPDGVARVAEFRGDILGDREPRGAETADAKRPDDRIRRARIGAMQGHEVRIPEPGRGPRRSPPERSR